MSTCYIRHYWVKRARPAVMALLLLATFLPRSSAQEGGDPVVQSDTMGRPDRIQLVGLPLLFYTPETQFGFGAGAQLFFPSAQNVYNKRKTNIFASAIYTTQNQFFIDIKPQLYLLDGDLELLAPFQYKVFPNLFWGIGNRTPEEDEEQYNMRTISIEASLLQRLPPAFNFGLRFWFKDHELLEIAEEGILASESVEGSEGARLIGLGAIINLDDRDVQEAPTRGNLVQFSGAFASRAFGATHSFNKFTLDFRHYFPLTDASILAVQLYSEANYGDVPFQEKAWLGGGEKMRGYFRGRYIDDHMFILQSEYRWRFKPRWIAAGFVSLGEVAPLPNNYFQVIRTSFGGGLRFQLSRNQPTLIRLDVGFNQEGGSGIYFGVNEAF